MNWKRVTKTDFTKLKKLRMEKISFRRCSDAESGEV